MKRRLMLAALLLLGLAASGCVGAGPGGGGPTGTRCQGRPDSSGTQPLFYLLCIEQTG